MRHVAVGTSVLAGSRLLTQCQSRVVQQVYSPSWNILCQTFLQELASSVNEVEQTQMHLFKNI